LVNYSTLPAHARKLEGRFSVQCLNINANTFFQQSFRYHGAADLRGAV